MKMLRIKIILFIALFFYLSNVFSQNNYKNITVTGNIIGIDKETLIKSNEFPINVSQKLLNNKSIYPYSRLKENCHSEKVNSVIFSPDGTKFASASDDNTIKIWNYTTGEILFTLSGHGDNVNTIAFSPDGKRLVSGGGYRFSTDTYHDYSIYIWDISTGKQIKTIDAHSQDIKSICYSADGKFFISASKDNYISIWDAETGKIIRKWEAYNPAYGISMALLSPDGNKIASSDAGNDNQIKIWNTNNGNLLKTISGPRGAAGAIQWFPDGSKLIIGEGSGYGNGDTIIIIDANTGTRLKTLKGHTDYITSLSISPDGTKLASGSYDNTIKIWNLSDGTVSKTLLGHDASINSVSFSPDGKNIISASVDKSIKIWDITTGACIKTIFGQFSSISSINLITYDNKLTVVGDDNSIKIWNLNDSTSSRLNIGKILKVNASVISLDGSKIAIGTGYYSGGGNDILIFDLKTGVLLKKISNAHSYEVISLAFSPDGLNIASGGGDGIIKVWGASGGNNLLTFSGHQAYSDINSLLFTLDGLKLISGCQDKLIKILDANTGKELKSLSKHTDYINSIAISPDGLYLASGSNDKTIKLWEITTGNMIKEFTGHSDIINSVVFSPDGFWLASASKDKNIMIWNIKSGKSFVSIDMGYEYVPNTICFTKDGKKIISGGKGKDNLRIYEVPVPKLPAITSLQEYTLTDQSVEIFAHIEPNLDETSIIFEYGTTTNYGKSLPGSPSSISTAGSSSIKLTGLTQNTTYHYRVKATNSVGTTYSDDKTFTTLSHSAPKILSGSLTKTTLNSATLEAVINPNFEPTTVVFEYGLTSNYGNTINGTPSAFTETKTVNTTITGLQSLATYHYRVRATNSLGTVYSGDNIFTTNSITPKIILPNNSLNFSGSVTGTVPLSYEATVTTFINFEHKTATQNGNTINYTYSLSVAKDAPDGVYNVQIKYFTTINSNTQNYMIYTYATNSIDDMNKIDYRLSQNYPNPFNPSTVISYQLSANSKVTLKIFDILGREIQTLIDEYKPAGEHKITFDANGLSGGIYFYKIQAGNYSEIKKMMFLK